MQEWGADRVEELAELVAAAAPHEDLTADELLTACFEQPGVVLGSEDGRAALAVGLWRSRDRALVATARLVVVHPDRQGAGVAGELLEAAEQWARGQAADRFELGGNAPFGLWPGVEAPSALARVADLRGFGAGDPVRTFAVASGFRAPPPDGVVVRRAVRDDDVAAVGILVAEAWPDASDEVARAFEHGTCHAAFDGEGSGAVLGIGCHSVTRAAAVGPFAVHPASRRRGVGLALLGQVCRDLMIAEFPAATVDAGAGDDLAAFLGAAGATLTVTRWPRVKDLRA